MKNDSNNADSQKHNSASKKWLLGNLKGTKKPVFISGFEWQCGWYWSGGYIGNKDLHCHFDGCFLEVPDYRGHPLGNFLPIGVKLPDYIKEEKVARLSNGAAVWEDLGFFLDNPKYTANEWWRIKDLFKQFYAIKAAAEVFRYGGNCTPQGRTEAEVNPDMAKALNSHIETVIIPEIIKALNHGKP